MLPDEQQERKGEDGEREEQWQGGVGGPLAEASVAAQERSGERNQPRNF